MHICSSSSANLGLFLLLSQLFIIIMDHYYHNIAYPDIDSEIFYECHQSSDISK